MKITYISKIAFSDVDLSYLYELSRIADVTYIVLVSPYDKASCAFDLRDIELKPGLNSVAEIPQLQKYSKLIDLNKVFFFKNSGLHAYDLNSFKYSTLLWRFVEQNTPDVIHLTYVPPISNNVLKRSLRERVVITIHDPIPHGTATYRMENLNRKLAFKLYSNFIILNKAQKEAFIDCYHLSKGNVRIFDSHLSSYNYLQLYKKNRPDETEPYILFFGNISPYKGLDYLFEAMSIVHKQNKEVKLVVAGRGDYYFDINSYRHMGCFDIRNNFIPDDELASLVNNSLFIVVPYVEATQSGVIMTAYAFNKPCVATNVGGLPEMVINNRYGLIVPPRDSAALSDAMLDLLGDRNKIELFTSNILKDYQEGEKSWRAIALQMLGIYKSIAKND